MGEDRLDHPVLETPTLSGLVIGGDGTNCRDNARLGATDPRGYRPSGGFPFSSSVKDEGSNTGLRQ